MCSFQGRRPERAKMYQQIKRRRTSTSENETTEILQNPTTIYEMSDDELLLASQACDEICQSQNQRSSSASTTTTMPPPPSPISTTNTVSTSHNLLGPSKIANINKPPPPQQQNHVRDIQKKLDNKEGEIKILKQNINQLEQKTARLNKEKCDLQYAQHQQTNETQKKLQIELDSLKSKLVFNEKEYNELQKRFFQVEERYKESEKTSCRLLSEINRLRSLKTSQIQQRPSTAATIVAHTEQQSLGRFRLLKTNLSNFSAYELLRPRFSVMSIEYSTTSSIQLLIEQIRPKQISLKIWQTLIDILFLNNKTTSIEIDMKTMTAFYSMIMDVLQLFNDQQQSMKNNKNLVTQQFSEEQLVLYLDACCHFLKNTVKSSSLSVVISSPTLTATFGQTTIKQEIETVDEQQSSQRSMTATVRATDLSAYYDTKQRCLNRLKSYLSHLVSFKLSFDLFHQFLLLYTFHFKTKPSSSISNVSDDTEQQQRRKGFCSFLIQLLNDNDLQQLFEFKLCKAILSSLIEICPDEPTWLCSLPPTRCLCEILAYYIDSIIYLDELTHEQIRFYYDYFTLIYSLHVLIYNNRKFQLHWIFETERYCDNICWLHLLVSYSNCLCRFLINKHIESTNTYTYEHIYRLVIKFIKLLIIFSTQQDLQLKDMIYSSPTLYNLYEVLLLTNQQI
ncbi:unnamed protein product, partial [Didymodactylos carnosus]